MTVSCLKRLEETLLLLLKTRGCTEDRRHGAAPAVLQRVTIPLCNLHKDTCISQQIVVLHHTACMECASSSVAGMDHKRYCIGERASSFHKGITFASPRAHGLGTTAVNEEKAECELEWWSMLSEPARPSPSCDIAFSCLSQNSFAHSDTARLVSICRSSLLQSTASNRQSQRHKVAGWYLAARHGLGTHAVVDDAAVRQLGKLHGGRPAA